MGSVWVKRCSQCGETKSLSEYYSRQSECKACARIRGKKYRAANKEKIKATQREYQRRNRTRLREYHREYRKKNKDRLNAQKMARRKADPDFDRKHREGVKRRRDKIRAEMIAAYGGHCVCCGEGNPLFLELDHVNGGGNAHRREIGARTSTDMYIWAKKNKWPNLLQLLCANCNAGKRRNGGVCPHKDSLI